MSEFHQELLQIADRLDRLAEEGMKPPIQAPLETLAEAAQEIGKSFGGSWLGYHANVYYHGLTEPPPGAHFSQEWGLSELFTGIGSRGDWQEYSSEAIKRAVHERADKPNLTAAHAFNDKAVGEFERDKSDVLSILETVLSSSSDAYLSRTKESVNKLSVLDPSEVAEHLRPRGQIMTRDTVVLGQGTKIPPHISVLAEALAIQHTIGVIKELGKHARQAGSHLTRQNRDHRRSETVGTNVFIGHGHSPLWRELKDFIEDRLRLPVDEFNRVPVAGVTNIARLSEMLDGAAIAFLLMTGEDEQPDGRLRARMNVVHEAGLFQGRLGFTRAIVVLEEECESFSNIEGLGQIRFPRGNIKAAFEEIRQVLEREGLVNNTKE